MKNVKTKLKVFCLGQSLIHTEWLSLQGHKYVDALPFGWEVVDQLESADVIAWDGLISPKAERIFEHVVEKLRSGKILLLQREAQTLQEKNPFVKLVDLDQIRYIELPGRSILPEELLAALEACHQKLAHV